MRQLAERHAAVVAADQYIDMVFAGELVDRRDADLGAVARRLPLVRHDHLELAPEHAALGVDLVDRHLDAVDGVAADLGLDGGVDADPDRLGLLRYGAVGGTGGERQHHDRHRRKQELPHVYLP